MSKQEMIFGNKEKYYQLKDGRVGQYELTTEDGRICLFMDVKGYKYFNQSDILKEVKAI